METTLRERPGFWPRNPLGALSYLGGWLCFASGYAGVHLLTSEPSFSRAATASVYVILPAAVLGLGVVWLCRWLPFPPRRPTMFALAHVALSFLYPLVWIVVVSGWAGIVRALRGAPLALSMPPTHVAHWHFLSGVMIYATLATVTYALAHVVRAETRRRQAELEATRAQLSPHFLFNTLHSVLALVRNDQGQAAHAIERFADLLRYSLKVQRGMLEQVQLSEEWAFTADYLALEQLRLGERLRLEVDLADEALECRVPAFLLQPLVENAVRYAVAPRANGGTIRIRAHCALERLHIEVADDGPGADAETGESSFGIGLQAAKTRVAHHYGTRARFVAAMQGEAGFRVTIDVPFQESARTR